MLIEENFNGETSCCIKEKTPPTWKESNILLEKVWLEDEIGHLFVVDTEFNPGTPTPRQLY